MKRTDPRYVRAYDRGVLRTAFVSLFWAVIAERKKTAGFTLQALAKALGTNKGQVSRWFNDEPNWTINTIASIASALGVELQIQARDLRTGAIFTPAGRTIVEPKIIDVSRPQTTAVPPPFPITATVFGNVAEIKPRREAA